jgi:uncharacterized protein involved in tolerance to divalent cations
VRFILEEEDGLTFYKALRAYSRGKFNEDSLEYYDKNVYRVSRASNLAQSEITFEFADDEKLFELLGLDDDDAWFARMAISSNSNIDIESYESIYDDFTQGYGSVFYNFNEENMKKLQEISVMILGKNTNLNEESESSLLAKTIDELFNTEASNIVSEYHTYLNEEIRITAKDSIKEELNTFLNKIGFELQRDFDMIKSTPANLIMWYLLVQDTDLNFEELFEKICEAEKSDGRGYRLGGWHENQYEFRDSNNFDDVMYNRDIERQLDRIIDKLEEDDDIVKVSQIYKQIFDMGYSIQKWEKLPKDTNYSFRIDEVDKTTLKLKIKLSLNPYDWNSKETFRSVDIEGFKLLLNHPELFKLQENIIKKLRRF